MYNHFNRLHWAAILHVSAGMTIKNSVFRTHGLFRLRVPYFFKINNSYFLKQHLPIGFYNGNSTCSLLYVLKVHIIYMNFRLLKSSSIGYCVGTVITIYFTLHHSIVQLLYLYNRNQDLIFCLYCSKSFIVLPWVPI